MEQTTIKAHETNKTSSYNTFVCDRHKWSITYISVLTESWHQQQASCWSYISRSFARSVCVRVCVPQFGIAWIITKNTCSQLLYVGSTLSSAMLFPVQNKNKTLVDVNGAMTSWRRYPPVKNKIVNNPFGFEFCLFAHKRARAHTHIHTRLHESRASKQGKKIT